MQLLFCSRCGWKPANCFSPHPDLRKAQPVTSSAVESDCEDSEDDELDTAELSYTAPSETPAPALSFRGDVYADSCNACASVTPTRGFVFGLLLDGELVYVGRSTVSMVVRQDRMWFEALEPRSKGYRSPLSAAIRETPDRGRWRAVQLQDAGVEMLRRLELAWLLHASPAGQALPRLNSPLPAPTGAEADAPLCLPMWSVHGAELVLHLCHVPRLTAGMFFEALKCDPEALKRIYRYRPIQ